MIVILHCAPRMVAVCLVDSNFVPVYMLFTERIQLSETKIHHHYFCPWFLQRNIPSFQL